MLTKNELRVTTLQPIPYQGSKRKLAPEILQYMPSGISRVVEPFAGSAAITIACALNHVGEAYWINDSYKPLTQLWRMIAANPEEVVERYTELWKSQAGDHERFYYGVRDRFNQTNEPVDFLFLMSKCAKNSVRFNSSGGFNQSPDKRRMGRSPSQMRKHILQVSLLLKKRLTVTNLDYLDVFKGVRKGDLIYMDPPYQGTSTGRNPRYHQGLNFSRFVEALEFLNTKGIPYLISFDGRCGDKVYGEELPAHLNLKRIDIHAGKSSQATLNGRSLDTIESLYLSKGL
jgi:DNA adenine methylase